MPNSVKCETCNGEGYYVALVSQHDNATETVKCPKCQGKGVIFQMTSSEENDYWENYS